MTIKISCLEIEKKTQNNNLGIIQYNFLNNEEIVFILNSFLSF